MASSLASASSRRLVLVPSAGPRRAAAPDARLRRYRLARVTVDDRQPRSEGFAHLRRMHD